ncbi:MAG: hypothetical protein HGGPFJEG_00496 [Ignavibacteria bacterium]|nr:hypothetical protein [Ignavibacteria bacterium]
METVILNSKSKSDIKLLVDLAKKIGIKTRVLSESEIEEIGLSFAIEEGRTKQYVNTDKYIKKLRR